MDGRIRVRMSWIWGLFCSACCLLLAAGLESAWEGNGICVRWISQWTAQKRERDRQRDCGALLRCLIRASEHKHLCVGATVVCLFPRCLLSGRLVKVAWMGCISECDYMYEYITLP
ncbi:hypothetical protein V8C34DRAFT_288940 [Trichoderma compactum]